MDNETRNELPKHMPVDMALAPDQKPYEHTHVIRTSSSQSEQNKLAQHSLSPEKLGVVGYVKDVAGFVKDVVHEHREKKAIARRNSASSVTSVDKKTIADDVPIAEVVDEKQRRRSSAEHHPQQQQSTAFANAITGLFPGVSSIGDVNAAGCSHADDLRSQMMHINDQQQETATGPKLL